tara:strand:+ start:329 stop:2173 length:1845 start_codon:yes stop_codon:yes gene_type:complete
MAEETQGNIFQRLGKLFRSNIVLRQTDSGKVVVKDIDLSQTALTSNFTDRYNRLYSKSLQGSNLQNPAYTAQRLELFKDYELMDTDPIISSALDVYSDECTVDNVEGEILNIKTDNQKLHKILHNLFYDILNIEFNLWSWIRNLVKYGDFYLQLDILDKHGVMAVKPMSVYDVERMEEHDPSNPDKVEFKILTHLSPHSAAMGSKDDSLLQQYEVAHFRLLSDANFLPYGKSQIEGARKVFKQLTLMEDAMLIHRIMRAPEKRIFKVDIGNIPPNEVENFMNKLINKMKKTPVIDQQTGEYNLRYNIESVTEDFFLPVRGGDSGTNIETLQGLANDSAIEDIEYVRNKLMAALRIPKAFLGYEEGVGSKATLAAEDVRFARTIERLQKIVVAELEKIAIVHLYTQGFEDTELIDFNIELTNPSMIHQQEKLELLTQQTEIATSVMENKLFSRDWVYDNIFQLNEHEKQEIFDGVIEDQKQEFRIEQIKMEGNDPAETGEKSMDMMGGGGGATGAMGGDFGGMGGPQHEDWGGSEKDRLKKDVNPHGASAEEMAKVVKYKKDKHGKREFKGKSPLATSKGATLVARESLMKSLKRKYGKNTLESGILSEDSIIDE